MTVLLIFKGLLAVSVAWNGYFAMYAPSFRPASLAAALFSAFALGSLAVVAP